MYYSTQSNITRYLRGQDNINKKQWKKLTSDTAFEGFDYYQIQIVKQVPLLGQGNRNTMFKNFSRKVEAIKSDIT